MPRPITFVYIAEGFFEDCDELISRCSQVGILNYQVFCNIWKDMGFAEIFKGRSMHAEVAEFSEETLYIAKRYMLGESDSYEASVAGLFLVYSLLNIQPYEGFAALRLVPEDMEAIKKLESIARRDKRLDVLYILGSILIKGPCQFHVAEREYGIEVGFRKFFEGPLSIEPTYRRVQGTLARHNEEFGLLKELESLGNRYSVLKKEICGSKHDPSLNYSNDKLAGDLKATFEKVASGIKDVEEATKKDTICNNEDYRSARSIKSKAMMSTVGKVKSYTGIEERLQHSKSEKQSHPEQTHAENPRKRKNIRKVCLKQRGGKQNNASTRNSQRLKDRDANLETEKNQNFVEIEIIDQMEPSNLGGLDLNTITGLPIIQKETRTTHEDPQPILRPRRDKTKTQDPTPPLIIKDEGQDQYYQVEVVDDVVQKLNNLPDIVVTMVNDQQIGTGHTEAVANDDHLFKRPPVPKLRKIKMPGLERLTPKKVNHRCSMLHLMDSNEGDAKK